MTSQLGALASVYFNECVSFHLPPAYYQKRPTFDARVWQVPNLEEGANVFLWREFDATKNSVQMLAFANFSHKELQGKNTKEMQHMLITQKGINWNDVETRFKRGTYVQRQIVSKPFSPEELASLNPKHNAHKDPAALVQRSVYRVVDMPPFGQVTNRAEVIFRGAEPQVLSQKTDKVVDTDAYDFLKENLFDADDYSTLSERGTDANLQLE